MPIPFQAVKTASASHAEAFCRRYLSAGKRSGQWWIAPVPWRKDNNPSLIVSLTTGHWEDKSLGDHGDMTDLYARLERCSLADAAADLAQMMGVA